MVFCRTGFGSDLYAFRSIVGGYEIFCPDFFYHCDTLLEFKGKLEELQSQGYKVPLHVFERINKELEEGKE